MLDPIATEAQADAFGFTGLDAGALLRASTRMRTFTRQEITRGTSTAQLLGAGPWLLPQRPVASIEAVRNHYGAAADYRLRGQLLHVWGAHDVEVDYTHGFAIVPDGLVELCCVIAQRLGNVPDDLVAGVQQQATGAESMSFGAWATDAVAELMPGEAKVLAKFYPPRRPRVPTMMRAADLRAPYIAPWGSR